MYARETAARASSNFEQCTWLQKGYTVTESTIDSQIIRPEEFAALIDVVLLTSIGYYRIDKMKPYLISKARYI
ncbi:MAG: hypothetical protein LBU32_02135 [Clostridiales bacterium]|nr:hypothetical protein [Clostridiales bacterium]